jgi:dTDP-glucose pyrophosphorylase
MLQIVIPMAGRGSRFADQGYKLPKPLIPVHGVPMTQLVIENLKPTRPHRFTFICQQAHLADYGLEAHLREWAPGCVVIGIDRVTEGAACTVLLAKRLIDSDDALMIANCDQYVDVAIDDYLADMDDRDLDGLIMTMKANDPKWSFVGFDDAGRVNTVVEKKVISDEATVGIYNYRRGADFVSAAEEMIARNLRVNNEFYVAPAYNLLIERGQTLGVHSIGTEGAGMYGLGIPEDLAKFESLDLSRRAARRALAGGVAA